MFNVEANAREIGIKAAGEAAKQGKTMEEASKIGLRAEREAIRQGNKWVNENVGLN
jgi:hypothetical protein